MTTEWSLLEANLRGCLARAKVFAPHNIEEIVRRIQQGFSAIDDLRCFGVIEAGRALTPEAKKRLGLNTRAKFTEEFIALVDVAKLNGESPLIRYRNAYMDAIAQTRRGIALEKMGRLGVKFVELIDPYEGVGGVVPGKNNATALMACPRCHFLAVSRNIANVPMRQKCECAPRVIRQEHCPLPARPAR